MGTLGASNRPSPLECPECGGKVLWDGNQHLCISCPWKEHVARPPSERRIPAVRKKKGGEEE